MTTDAVWCNCYQSPPVWGIILSLFHIGHAIRHHCLLNHLRSILERHAILSEPCELPPLAGIGCLPSGNAAGDSVTQNCLSSRGAVVRFHPVCCPVSSGLPPGFHFCDSAVLWHRSFTSLYLGGTPLLWFGHWEGICSPLSVFSNFVYLPSQLL